MLAMALDGLPRHSDSTTSLRPSGQCVAHASGVNWQDAIEYRQNFVSRNLSSAVTLMRWHASTCQHLLWMPPVI
jgi:hypothetical protein